MPWFTLFLSFTLIKGVSELCSAAGSDPFLRFSPHTKLWPAARPPRSTALCEGLRILTPPPRCSYAIITQTCPVNTKHPVRNHSVTTVKLLRCEQPCVINRAPPCASSRLLGNS